LLYLSFVNNILTPSFVISENKYNLCITFDNSKKIKDEKRNNTNYSNRNSITSSNVCRQFITNSTTNKTTTRWELLLNF